MMMASLAPLVAAALLGCLSAAAPPATLDGPSVDSATADSPTEGTTRRVRLTALGDVNFNQNRVEVRPDGVTRYGRVLPFSSSLTEIAPLIDGDVNFVNLETVVTDRNDIAVVKEDKPFCFRTHPEAVRALQAIGVNLMSLANNHSVDYGTDGVLETLRWMEVLSGEHPLATAGLGADRTAALAPGVLDLDGVRVGLVAVTIGRYASDNRAGPASVAHAKAGLKRLRAADVHLRVLSIHAGTNRTLTPDGWQLPWARRAIRDYEVDLVLMHHPHRAQGLERYGGGLIAYGLGNGVMHGARDLAADPTHVPRHDFGLLVAVNAIVDLASGEASLDRVEVVPLTGMHLRPRPLVAREAARRIEVLNELSTYERLETDCGTRCIRRDRDAPLVLEMDGDRGVASLRPAPAR